MLYAIPSGTAGKNYLCLFHINKVRHFVNYFRPSVVLLSKNKSMKYRSWPFFSRPSVVLDIVVFLSKGFSTKKSCLIETSQ